jgi:hypothetical protein
LVETLAEIITKGYTSTRKKLNLKEEITRNNSEQNHLDDKKINGREVEARNSLIFQCIDRTKEMD